MNIKIGDKAETIKIYTTDLVRMFSQISGDINPIHLDKEYALNTLFKKPIVHGMLVASQISELLANTLPGPGTIYLSQELKFIHPVYHDDEIKCIVEILEINYEKRNVLIQTRCYNQNNLTVLDGIAKVRLLNK